MTRDSFSIAQGVAGNPPENLEGELEAATREFFSKENHLRIDHEKKHIYVSSILDFHTKDFVPSGKKEGLPGYINKFLDKPLPKDYKVRFIDYDWRINTQPSSGEGD